MDFSMDNLADLLGGLREEDLQSLRDTAASLFGNDAPKSDVPEDDDGIDPAMMRKIMRLMHAMQSHQDERSALIRALKPYLSEPRQRRAEEAMQLLRMLDILPMLQENGR